MKMKIWFDYMSITRIIWLLDSYHLISKPIKLMIHVSHTDGDSDTSEELLVVDAYIGIKLENFIVAWLLWVPLQSYLGLLIPLAWRWSNPNSNIPF